MLTKIDKVDIPNEIMLEYRGEIDKDFDCNVIFTLKKRDTVLLHEVVPKDAEDCTTIPLLEKVESTICPHCGSHNLSKPNDFSNSSFALHMCEDCDARYIVTFMTPNYHIFVSLPSKKHVFEKGRKIEFTSSMGDIPGVGKDILITYDIMCIGEDKGVVYDIRKNCGDEVCQYKKGDIIPLAQFNPENFKQ